MKSFLTGGFVQLFKLHVIFFFDVSNENFQKSILLLTFFKCLLIIPIFSMPYSIASTGVDSGLGINLFLNSVEEAFVQKNVKGIENFISDSFKVVVYENGEVYEYDKQSYLNMLRNGWSRVTDYSYRRVDTKINSLKADKAHVEQIIIEEFILDGENYSYCRYVDVDIKILNNRILASLIVVRSRKNSETHSKNCTARSNK